MVGSNIFLLLPVFGALYMREWIYFIIAFSATITSSLYHYVVEYHPENIQLRKFARNVDWLVAACAYAYMFYYIFTKVIPSLKFILAFCLGLTLVFFWYGYKVRGYKKTHPIFHAVTSIISVIIVLSRGL